MSWSRRDFLRTGSAFAAAGIGGLDPRLRTDPALAALAFTTPSGHFSTTPMCAQSRWPRSRRPRVRGPATPM